MFQNWVDQTESETTSVGTQKDIPELVDRTES